MYRYLLANDGAPEDPLTLLGEKSYLHGIEGVETACPHKKKLFVAPHFYQVLAA